MKSIKSLLIIAAACFVTTAAFSQPKVVQKINTQTASIAKRQFSCTAPEVVNTSNSIRYLSIPRESIYDYPLYPRESQSVPLDYCDQSVFIYVDDEFHGNVYTGALHADESLLTDG